MGQRSATKSITQQDCLLKNVLNYKLLPYATSGDISKFCHSKTLLQQFLSDPKPPEATYIFGLPRATRCFRECIINSATWGTAGGWVILHLREYGRLVFEIWSTYSAYHMHKADHKTTSRISASVRLGNGGKGSMTSSLNGQLSDITPNTLTIYCWSNIANCALTICTYAI